MALQKNTCLTTSGRPELTGYSLKSQIWCGLSIAEYGLIQRVECRREKKGKEQGSRGSSG